MKRGLGIILLALTVAAASCFGLDWPVRAIELKADPAKGTCAAVFPFKNTGDKMVVITSVVPSCDCLSPKLAKEFITPGESGELPVTFALAGRSGRSTQTITVTTDDMPQAPVVLQLIVDIPEPVALSARSIFWRVGEPAGEKLIEVIFAEPDKSTLGGVQCAEKSFVIRLEPGTAPGRHRILIRPTDTATLAQATVRLAATVDGRPRILILQVGVK